VVGIRSDLQVEAESVAKKTALRDHGPLFEGAIFGALDVEQEQIAFDTSGHVGDLGAVLAIERVGRARKLSWSRCG
jgi:hypothetical protein